MTIIKMKIAATKTSRICVGPDLLGGSGRGSRGKSPMRCRHRRVTGTLLLLLSVGVVGAVEPRAAVGTAVSAVERVQVPDGGFPLSMTPMPANDPTSWSEHVASYKLARDLGTSVAHHYMNWGDIERDAGDYAWDDPADAFALASSHGMVASMELTIINVDTVGRLPRDLEGRSLGDPLLRQRFLSFVGELARRSRNDLDYLWIGNEVDIYLDQNPSELDTWTNLYRDAVQAVRTEAPGIAVGTVMTYHNALGNGRTSWVDRWGPYSDIIGVTFYPQFMPNGYEIDKIQSQIDGLVNAYGKYPLAIVESAVSAASDYGGGPSEQVEYCKEFFKALARHESDFAFAGWFNLHDFPPGFLAYYPSSLRNWLGSLALADFNANPRSVMSQWAEEARNLYSNKTDGTLAAATLVAPAGGTADASPTYSWNPVSASTMYRLRVEGSAGEVFTQSYSSAAASCSAELCSVTPTVTLPAAVYLWSVMASNSTGNGPWSPKKSFTVSVSNSGGPPPNSNSATPVAPSGTVTTSSPTYTWSELTGSTSYYLRVQGGSGGVVLRQYTSSQANCSAGSCSATSPVSLADGNYVWSVRTENDSGDGPWSPTMGFTVSTRQGRTQPPAGTLLAPMGDIATSQPTFSWSEITGATWYYLWVSDLTNAGGPVVQQWFRAGLNLECSEGVCNLKSPVPLANGPYRWFLRPWTATSGVGPWTAPQDFVIRSSGLGTSRALRYRGPRGSEEAAEGGEAGNGQAEGEGSVRARGARRKS